MKPSGMGLWGLGVSLSDEARSKLVIMQQYDEQESCDRGMLIIILVCGRPLDYLRAPIDKQSDMWEFSGRGPVDICWHCPRARFQERNLLAGQCEP